MPKKLRILITAGPTREPLDPVRFLSNVSTGAMGYALARKARALGHQVILISGPTALKPPKGVKFFPIIRAKDLKKAMLRVWPKADVLIMSAAVCDYMPLHYSRGKIKRVQKKSIQFKRTPDILQYFGSHKKHRVVMGFSLETSQAEENARKKIKRKHLDYIAVNWYGQKNNPFGKTSFSTIILDKKNGRRVLKKVSKSRAASLMLKYVLDDPKIKNMFKRPEKA